MLNKLWERTKEVASLYTGTFIVVMFLNQLLFFGLCLNPICLIAAMPHVLFITVIIGTWLNRKSSKDKKEQDKKLDRQLNEPKSSSSPKNVSHRQTTTQRVVNPTIQSAKKERVIENLSDQVVVAKKTTTQTTKVRKKTESTIKNHAPKMVSTKLKVDSHKTVNKTNQPKLSNTNSKDQSALLTRKPITHVKKAHEKKPKSSVSDRGKFNKDNRLRSLSEQKEEELALITSVDKKTNLESLVKEACPSCGATKLTKTGKTPNNIQRFSCNECSRRFQENTASLDKSQHLDALRNDAKERIKHRHNLNVKFKLREKLLSTSIDTDVVGQSSIVIELTPERYLEARGRNKRRSLTGTPLASSRFSMEHDINNAHDPLAIRVLFDGIDIGFVKKHSNSKSVDKFCFNTFDFKGGLKLLWDGSRFTINGQEHSHMDMSLHSPLDRFGVRSIWHMSHIDNVGSILNSGVMSNSNAYNHCSPVDISNQDVQAFRTRKEPLYGRRIHDYAPTYLSIRNPMLFTKKDTQSNLCIFEISLAVLQQHQFIFTDGNAASRDTKFFNKLSDLKNLPWDVLNSDYWNDFDDGKRKKCAEFLIFPSVHRQFIRAVHCSNHVTKSIVEKRSFSGVPIKVSPELFF